jgi:trigger factor
MLCSTGLNDPPLEGRTMSYKVESLDGCTRKLSFHFPKIDLSQEIKVALVDKQRMASIKGFRKGKAPLSLIEGLYRSQIENDALMNFISREYSQALEKESLRPAGRPALSNTNYDESQGVKFEAIVEIFPSIRIMGLENLTFEKKNAAISAEDIEIVKKRLLEGKAFLEEVAPNTPIDKGHLVTINFQGHLGDGTWLPELSGKDVVVDVGAGKFLKEFEEGMLNGVKNQLINVSVTFPESYHAEHLRDKTAQFEIDILEIKSKKFPEFNEDFVREYGHESTEQFEAKVKENLQSQRSKELEEELFKNILEKIIEMTPFDVPKSLILAQEEYIKDDLSKTLRQQGMNSEMSHEYFDKWKEDITKKAIYQVRSGLILDTLAKEFAVETTPDDIEAKIDEMSQGGVAKKEDILKYYRTSPDNLRNLNYKIREEKTFKKLLSLIKLV